MARNRSVRSVFFLFWGVAALSGSVRADFIDSFAVGPQVVTADPSNNNAFDSADSLDSNAVFGGQRRLTVQGEMSSGSITATVDTAAGGQFAFQSQSPVYTNQFDGRLILAHLSGNRLETSDLSPYQDQFYTIDVLAADWGATSSSQSGEVRLSSSRSSASVPITFLSSSTPYSVSVPLSSFTGIDLTSVFNMTLDIGGVPSDASFSIASIRFAAVPEPTSLGMLALCGLPLLLFRRRAPAI